MTEAADPSPPAGPMRSRFLFVLALCVLGFLTFVRAPAIWLDGRFWAEEGTVYFAQALAEGGATLFRESQGYYSLFNRVVSLLATLVPLEYAPWVTTCGAASVYLGAVAVYRYYDATRFGYLAFGLLLMLVPPSEEVWMNSINTQFVLAVAAAVILALPTRTGRARYPALCALVVAGLTGLVSVFLAPLFLLRAWMERDVERMWQSSCICACALLQIPILLATTSRSFSVTSDVLVALLFFKNLSVPFFPSSQHLTAVARSMHEGSYFFSSVHFFLSLALLAILSALPFGARQTRREVAYLLGAGFMLSVLCTIGSLAENKWVMVGHLNAGRYYFAPNVLIAAAVLASLKKASLRSVRGILSAAILGWMLTVGAVWFVKMPDAYSRGPVWSEEIRAFRSGETQRIAILPRGWFLNGSALSRHERDDRGSR